MSDEEDFSTAFIATIFILAVIIAVSLTTCFVMVVL